MTKFDRSFLRKIQTDVPAVHCLTNTVVQNLTANMLLAAGAVPSMSSDITEVPDFVRSADALLVNIGTLDAELKVSIEAAIEAAHEARIPWIFDPVFIDRAPARLDYARKLAKLGPAVIRGNAVEIGCLGNDPEALARQSGAVVAVTGQTDLVTDGQETHTLTGGHRLMSQVTGIGCAGTAVLAAFCAVTTPDQYRQAVASGLGFFGTAGERAAKIAPAPGSFGVAILDQVFEISQSTLLERTGT